MIKYLLKVDISGIQEFIFDVPRDGAARNLKGRSFFIQALTEIAERFFIDTTGSNKDVLYNGGGNLFLYLNTLEEMLQMAIRQFQSCFRQQHIFPYIAYVAAESDKTFDRDMSRLNQEITRQKLRKPVSFEEFTPLAPTLLDEKFKAFTQMMVSAHGYLIEKCEDAVFDVHQDRFELAGYRLQLSREAAAPSSFADSIINAMPLREDGTLLDFDGIAKGAESRSVDAKLAAVKMDVDNLGQLFREKTKDQYQVLSQGIHLFFSKTLYIDLLKAHIENGEVYPVFAGGDDCFLIGVWDKTLEIACKIQQKFDTFQSTLRTQIAIDKPVTLSAGIVICNPKYPLARMAEEAESALELAKDHGKNRVCLFGEVLAWDELARAKDLAEMLQELIDSGESRSVLERIRSSEIGFRSLQQRAINYRKIDFPKVYRLKYYLRNAKKAENREKLEAAFDQYAETLLKDFINQDKNQPSNAAQFPVAARWAELLTKTSTT